MNGHDAACVVCIAALSVGLYAHTLDGTEYVLDDKIALLLNEDVTGKRPVGGLWWSDFWGRPIASSSSHKSYRPLSVLSFRTVASVLGLDQRHQHCVNVALYTAVCVAWFAFLRRRRWVSRPACLVAALLFAAHPMHVENVVSIVGRADIMSGMAYLAAIDAYVVGAAAGSPVLYVLACDIALVAMLCKETGLLALPVAAAVDLIQHGKALQWWTGGRRVPLPAALQGAVFRTSVAAGVTVACLVWGVWLRGGQGAPDHSPAENPIPFEKSMWVRALWQSQTHAWYLLLLCVPAWSCSHWGLAVVPPPATPLAGCAAYAAVFGPLVGLARTPWAEQAALCVVFLVVPFLPASGMVRVGTFIAERLLFLPSMGFTLAAATVYDAFVGAAPGGAGAAAAQPARRRMAWGVVLLVLCCFTARTVPRGAAWKESLTLFNWDVAECERSVNSLASLGVVYTNAGEYDRAEAMLLRAAALKNSSGTWHKLGRVADKRQDAARARRYYEMAVDLTDAGKVPAPALLFDLMHLLCELNELNACKKAFNSAQESFAAYHDPMRPAQLAGFAKALMRFDLDTNALKHLDNAVSYAKRSIGRVATGSASYCKWSFDFSTYLFRAHQDRAHAAAVAPVRQGVCEGLLRHCVPSNPQMKKEVDIRCGDMK